VSSPPVAPRRVCANGQRRVRLVRARTKPAGFLVLAASFVFLAINERADGQFPIRQVPGVGSQVSGVRNQKSGVGFPTAESTADHRFPTPDPRPPTPVPGPYPAVARITVVEKDGISYGTGTLVDARGEFGLVVSNWHVVRDSAGPITAEFPDGFKSPAQVVKTDKDWDLAALSIYRPRAAPLSVSPSPPQLGEPLTIAGYGSGQWRVASGRCTQYLAPGLEFPHEMVELAAEARQGDSGGPILNQRGELAGVLFGSGPGYTSGSYGGRVLQFLAMVVPGGVPGSEGSAPTPPQVADRGLAVSRPNYTDHMSPVSPPPQVTALHESKLAVVGEPADSIMTPVRRERDDALLSPPPLREVAERFGSLASEAPTGEVEPRVAVVPSRVDFNSTPLAVASDAPLAPVATARSSVPAASVDLAHAPPEQLLAAAWRQIGGVTMFDQAKAVLAIIGLMAMVVVFIRFGSHNEREHEED
jgi:S1-C subfamily serine protease